MQNYRLKMKRRKIEAREKDLILQFEAIEEGNKNSSDSVSEEDNDIEMQENSDDTDSGDTSIETSKKKSKSTIVDDSEINKKLDSAIGLVEQEEIQELRKLIVESNVSHTFTDKLLKILRKRLIPSLPKCTKTFLKSNINTDVEPMKACNGSTGEFFYIGLESKLENYDETLSTTDKDIFDNNENINNSNNLSSTTNETKSETLNTHKYQEMGQNTLYDVMFPVVNLDEVECSTPYETAVLARLSGIQKDIADIKNYLSDKDLLSLLNTQVDFENKYNLKLPLADVSSFEKFDKNIVSNSLFKTDVIGELRDLIDVNYVITKSYTKMIRRFITKELALQFTAVRKGMDVSKSQFMNTQLCKCMNVVISETRKAKKLPIDEKAFTSSLSDVFTNIKKWK